MLKPNRRLAPLFLAFLLSACAAGQMTERQCARADWFALGEKDALAGETSERILERRDECAAFSIEADRRAYADGYGKTLFAMCTRDGGYAFGARDTLYKGVCPAEMEMAFLQGYVPGRRIAVARAFLRIADDNYEEAQEDYDFYANEVDKRAEELNEPELTDKERRNRRRALYNAEVDLDRKKRELEDAREALREAEREVENRIETEPEYLASRDFVYDVWRLRAAHNMARWNRGDFYYCYDALRTTPYCRLQAGPVVDNAGRTCGYGPGEAQLFRWRGKLGEGGVVLDHRMSYNLYGFDENGEKLLPQANGAFIVSFDENGEVEDMACATPSDKKPLHETPLW